MVSGGPFYNASGSGEEPPEPPIVGMREHLDFIHLVRAQE